MRFSPSGNLKEAWVGSDEDYVEREALNGGFPEPPSGGWVRVVKAEHNACGGETRVRLPGSLPAGAVRRVICQSCAQPFEGPVEEVEVLAPPPPMPEPVMLQPAPATMAEPSRARRLLSSAPSLPSPPALPRLRAPRWLPALSPWFSDPGSRGRRYLSIALGAVAVIAVLMILRDSDEAGTPFSQTTNAGGGAVAEPVSKGAGTDSNGANLVRESSFSLAMPDGWQRSGAAGGATFAAAAAGGEADATLWVERDPQLDFPSFEARSLDQLRSLAGSAHVVKTVAAPTPEATVVTLAADAPEGSPVYEVTLRASGPYRYYLSTTVQPGASRSAVDGAKLIQNSFVPTGAKGG